MAHVITGKSCCALCGEVLGVTDNIVGTCAFLPPGHQFWKFSDAPFHERCATAWADGEEFFRLYREFQKLWDERPTPSEGMNFSDFEKTEAYRVWGAKIEAFPSERSVHDTNISETGTEKTGSSE